MNIFFVRFFVSLYYHCILLDFFSSWHILSQKVFVQFVHKQQIWCQLLFSPQFKVYAYTEINVSKTKSHPIHTI